LVAIDKFTKWIEVKPVTCLKADRVLDFLDELVHRYGLPHRIITNLGSNFNNHQFWEYCENSGIDVRYVSVAHPRANGQVERANGMVPTLSRSGYTTLLTLKEASGSRNYPTHSGGYVLSPPSQRGNLLTSWSTAEDHVWFEDRWMVASLCDE
jgi:transposase InsO family protein